MQTISVKMISEDDVAKLVTRSAIFDTVENMFAAMAKGDAYNFPVIRENLGHADAIFGFKSGFDRAGNVLGVKAGGYWPHNLEKGIMNHQSSIILFDPDTGRCEAMVSGNRLTALRTAASSAISIAHLARKDASTLGILGAGGQAEFQIRAALEQRDFKQLLIAARSRDKGEKLAASLADTGVEITIEPIEKMARQSDVIITVTPSFAPILEAGWVQPGTHIACMGADTKGKQEVAQDIFQKATAFTDEIAQAITIGECQHAFADGSLPETAITPIGNVIVGDRPGRTSDEQITVFDGTGVGLQDLVAAKLALELADAS